MVHRNSNGALIEGNISRDNRGAGIAIFDSHDAIVRNNTVANNGESAIRLSVGSSRNLIENNTLTGLAASGAGPGYVVYTYKGSDPPTSGDGLPKNNTFRSNRLIGYKSPLMKLSETTGNVFEANTIAGPATDMAFSQATGAIVRDGELGASFQIALDPSSSMTLQDTRGAVWLLSGSGLGATVDSNGSALNLTFANAGPGVTVTTLDLAIKPQNGAITVLPSAWGAGARRWSESASTPSGPIAHRAGGLTARACYGVTANGASIGAFTADSSGHIALSLGGQIGTVNVAISVVAVQRRTARPGGASAAHSPVADLYYLNLAPISGSVLTLPDLLKRR